MPPLPAYILAGGRSSRFGSDKALACIDGSPLILRQAEALRAHGHETVVVADVAGKYAHLGLPTIADSVPNAGPLAGLLAALEHAAAAGRSHVLLTACDVLTLRETWIDQLAQAALSAPAAACRGAYWHPLPAVYATAVEPVVRTHLVRGDRSLWRLLEAVGAVALPLPADWPPVLQANTREDLDAFLQDRQRRP